MKRAMLIAAVLMAGVSFVPNLSTNVPNLRNTVIRRDLQSVTIEGYTYSAQTHYLIDVPIPDLGTEAIDVYRGTGSKGSYQFCRFFQARNFAPGRVVLPVNREGELDVNVRIDHGGRTYYEGVIAYSKPPAKRRAVR